MDLNLKSDLKFQTENPNKVSEQKYAKDILLEPHQSRQHGPSAQTV